MKKVVIYLVALMFLFTGMSFAGQNDRRKNDQKGYYQEQQDVQRYHKKHKKHRKDRHEYRGYRDKYYGQRHHPPKRYRGHWRSWDQFDRYRRDHRSEYRHGRYYQNNGHLYFRFQTDEGTFSFSIGR